MKKWTIGLSILIILAAAGTGAYYYYFAKDKVTAGAAATSRTVTATKGSIVKQVSGTGAVAANSRETVTAGKSGTIAAVNVKKGDKVKAGQVLATFEAASDYDDKIATIQKSITKLNQSIADDQESYKEATGTPNEELTKKTLQKNINNANFDIADYKEQLSKIYAEQAKEQKSVLASIDGEITEMNIAAGDEVNANMNVAAIVDYTKLEFVTSVDELDIASIKVGQAAAITLSSITNRSIKATVSDIAREGTSSNGSSAFSVNILLNDIDGVMVGMSGEAAITIESKENIILVPVNAVVVMGTRSFVRVPGETSGAASTGGQQPERSGARPSSSEGAEGTGARQSAGGRGTAGAGQTPADGGQARWGNGQGAAGSGTAAQGGLAAGGRAGGQMPDTLGGQLVEVTTGLSNESFVEIVSGLKEGDSVLIPLPQGTVGMGSSSQEMMQQGGFAGGGMGFPGGAGMGGMGGGAGRGTTRSTTGGSR